MTYRDDLEAAQARIAALEQELAEARRERDQALAARHRLAQTPVAAPRAAAPPTKPARQPEPPAAPPSVRLEGEARQHLLQTLTEQQQRLAETPSQEHRLEVARTLMELGQWARARLLLEEAEAGHFGGSRVTRGDVLLELGRIEAAHCRSAEALGYYQRGLRHEPDHAGLNQAVLDLARA